MSAPDVGHAHRMSGWNLFRVRRYADAVREALLALAADPADAEAHRLRALSLSMLGRHSEAADAVGDALRADPQSEWTHRIHAQVLLTSGQPRPALAAAKEAIRLLPAAAEGHSLAAEIHLRLGENTLGLASARRALAIDPHHAASLVRAAHAAARLGQPKLALECARLAVSVDPEDADTHRALGVAAFAAGDRALSRSALREALRLEPMNDGARVELLRTLRSRSPVYRVTDSVTRWFQGQGTKVTRMFGIGLWLTARAASGISGHREVGLVFLIVPVALALPLWIVPLHDLIVWRDPFGRWLLDRWEKVGAAFTAAALVVALALLVAFGATNHDTLVWAAASFAALGAYGSLVRRVRTTGAAWRIGAVAVILVGALIGGLIADRLGDQETPKLIACLFVVALLLTFLARRRLVGRPPQRAG